MCPGNKTRCELEWAAPAVDWHARAARNTRLYYSRLTQWASVIARLFLLYSMFIFVQILFPIHRFFKQINQSIFCFLFSCLFSSATAICVSSKGSETVDKHVDVLGPCFGIKIAGM